MSQGRRLLGRVMLAFLKFRSRPKESGITIEDATVEPDIQNQYWSLTTV